MKKKINLIFFNKSTTEDVSLASTIYQCKQQIHLSDPLRYV